MNRIIVQLGDELLEELDRAVEEEAVSRAAFVREAIVMMLAERRRRCELQAVVDSYTAEPMESDLALPIEAVRKAWPE